MSMRNLLSHRRMARVELTPEENLQLLQEIETNREFILLAYRSDPALLAKTDPEIKRLFEIAEPTPESYNAGAPKPA